MDIGTGIFASALVISVVALYISTKDRWNWKLIGTRFILGLISVVILIGGCVWLKNTYDNRVITLNEFLGINLADTGSDIKFKKGVPLASNDHQWIFNDTDGNPSVTVLFKDEQVKAVIYTGGCGYCNNVAQIGIGSSYDEVILKLGKPTYISESKDSLTRLVSFDETHLVFHVEKGKVIAYGIYNPQIGRIEFSK